MQEPDGHVTGLQMVGVSEPWPWLVEQGFNLIFNVAHKGWREIDSFSDEIFSRQPRV